MDNAIHRKKGVLLVNLGSPEDYNFKSVYAYLTQFLNDPRVIDLPFLLRWALVNVLIVPLRTHKSARAYAQIWTDRSAPAPLIKNGRDLASSLQQELGPEYRVTLGMRYGKPSIQSSLAALADCDEITFVPLFPQYSSAATGSVIEEFCRVLSSQWHLPQLKIVNDFYDHNGFIAAYAEVISGAIKQQNINVLILSYHGLPLRHIDKNNCQIICDRQGACPEINEINKNCYRAQCYATSKQIAKILNLQPKDYQVAFQSRLGRTPWIKPYTDVLLQDLRLRGIKNIAIACPSFVADCLETLEEVNIRARAQWKNLGGENFIFIPCLNKHPVWVRALADIINGKH